jgi:ABC-type dipeptide/oligopeptide/nickel transport system permease subunit
VVLSGMLGATIGIVSAWFGGWVDGLSNRVIDVIFAIPGLILAILAVAMFGKGLIAPITALSIAYVPIVARLVRGGARTELGRPYIAALRIQGIGSFAICFRHLVPALLPMIIAQSTVGFGYAMLDLAAISFLGLGAQPPASDWGVMIASGQPSLLAGAPEQSVFPAALVVVTVLAVNVLGARLTDWAEGWDR